MGDEYLATVQRMFTKAQSTRCTTRPSAVLRLSDGHGIDFRVTIIGLFSDNMPLCSHVSLRWLQTKWNTVVAPLVRELSMNKCAQPKAKGSSAAAAAAASAIASSLRANSLEISTPYESVACTALYVLLHRAVSRDCPLTGQGLFFSAIRQTIYWERDLLI